MGALKKLVQVIGKTIGILVVVVIGYFAYLNWPKHQPSFNAEIVVDLVVDGETVNLQRIIECSTIARPSGSLKNVFTKRRSTVHASTVGAIGKRLKSGGAIMMWTPYRCAHEEVEKGFWTTNRRVIPNEPDYIPFMGWTPDADKLDIVEVYPAAAYFKNPHARIKLVKLTVQNASNNSRADSPDEFGWFASKLIPNERPNNVYFRGVNALVLKSEDWSGKDKLFDAALARAESLWAITKTPVTGGIWAWKRAQQMFTQKFGNPYLGIPEQFRLARPIERSIQSPVRSRDALSEAVVLKRDDVGSIEIANGKERAFVRLYRWKKRSSVSIFRAIWKRDGRQLVPNPNHPSSFLYDPSTKEIYWIKSVRLGGQSMIY